MENQFNPYFTVTPSVFCAGAQEQKVRISVKKFHRTNQRFAGNLRVKFFRVDGPVTGWSNWIAEAEPLPFTREETGDIVICADFCLTQGNHEEIKAKMKELIGKRSASQPLDLPSAGSAFKRPVGGYAAALIDQTGLKGFQVGGAAVSEKHAGFVVNLGGATAADVHTK